MLFRSAAGLPQDRESGGGLHRHPPGGDRGRISEARLDESVYRILSLKAEYGITSQPVSEPDVAALNETISAILPEPAETPAE